MNDPTRSIHLDGIKLFGRGVLTHHEGQPGPAPPVELHHPGQIDFRHHVAVDDEKRFSVQILPGRFDAAGRAQDLVLARKFKPHPEPRTVAKVIENLLRQVVQVDDDLANILGAETVKGVLQKRPVEHGKHGLRTNRGQGPKPGAETRRQDHRFHGTSVSRFNDSV